MEPDTRDRWAGGDDDGPDDPEEFAGGGPGGTPRRTWIGLGLVAVLLIGYAVTHRYSVADRAAPGPSPSATPGPTQPPTVLDGRVGPGPAGVRLYVGGAEPRRVEADSGFVEPIEIPGAGAGNPARLKRVGPAMVAFVRMGDSSRLVAILIRPSGQNGWLGAADDAVAAADGGVITVLWTAQGSELVGFTAAGKARWHWSRVGYTVEPLVDTPYGLLVHEIFDRDQHIGPIRLFDTATGRLRREIARSASAALAAQREQVAWTSSRGCPTDCTIRISTLRNGATATVPNQFGRAPEGGAYSPDGRHLALPFGAAAAGADPAGVPGLAGQRQTAFVGVVDIGSGFGIRVLPGYSAVANPAASVAWLTDRVLVLQVPDTAKGEVRVAFVPNSTTESPVILPWVFPLNAGVTVAP